MVEEDWAVLGKGPWLPHFAAAQPICFIVFEKTFLDGVPFQWATQLDGKVRKVADGGHPMTDIDGEIGILSGFHAIEKVAMLSLRVGEQPGLALLYHGIEDFVGTGLKLGPPPDVAHPALGSNEFQAGISGGAGHFTPFS